MSYYPPNNYGYQPPGSAYPAYPPQPSAGGIGFESLTQPAPAPAPAPGYPPSGAPYPPQSGYPSGPGMYPQAPAPSPYSVAGGMPMPGAAPSYPSQPSGYSFSSIAMASTAFRPPSAQPQYQPPPQPGYQPVSQPQYQPVSQPQFQSAPPAAPMPNTSQLQRHNTLPARFMSTQGTVKDHQGFRAEQDAEILRKAMKGWGCDEKAVMHVLASRSNRQRQQIMLSFKTMYGRDLLKDLKSELGGNFEDVVLALMMTPAEYDAHQLRRAMKGLGTDETVLIEILCTRTNEEMRDVTAAFQKLYSRKLEQDIHSETSGHFRRLLVSLVQGNREETGYVDINRARTDAKMLYDAGEGRWGTDESRFNVILASRSYPQLRATFDEYKKLGKYSIEASLERELSGDLKDGMMAIVKCVKNTPGYFAEKLYYSMKGLGTDDNTLIRIIVSRSEIDMVQIKEEFRKMYGKTLGRWITDDTSGHYKHILLALIGGVN